MLVSLFNHSSIFLFIIFRNIISPGRGLHFVLMACFLKFYPALHMIIFNMQIISLFNATMSRILRILLNLFKTIPYCSDLMRSNYKLKQARYRKSIQNMGFYLSRNLPRQFFNRKTDYFEILSLENSVVSKIFSKWRLILSKLGSSHVFSSISATYSSNIL
jgi:hypothetical protein